MQQIPHHFPRVGGKIFHLTVGLAADGHDIKKKQVHARAEGNRHQDKNSLVNELANETIIMLKSYLYYK